LISVCSITVDFPHLEWQVESLKRQDCDFEWIVVDDKYEEHKDILSNAIGDSFRFLHIPPRVMSPYYSPGMSYNTALSYVRGELVYFMADKIVPKLNCLNRHWHLHQKYPKAFFSGRRLGVGMTHEMIKFDEMMYVDGIDDRQNYIMSHDPENVFPTDEEGVYKMGGTKMESWWAGCNDSAPMEALIAVNGLDETLDGMRRDIDRNLAWRLHNYGLDYIFDENCTVLSFDRVGGTPKQTTPECGGMEYMHKLFEKLKATQTYLPEHKFDLKAEREKI